MKTKQQLQAFALNLEALNLGGVTSLVPVFFKRMFLTTCSGHKLAELLVLSEDINVQFH